ncbi:probable calcium-binding protein CML46 [Andrographis paniculata]|uniref:probable calcium-binding protein CML46 n=1 Tax=Andrographis paniculata TaxID=175694 RepID=UPI0021E7976F|nr:probable calcium-binding protein CML46 [Andrographis paniculata]
MASSLISSSSSSFYQFPVIIHGGSTLTLNLNTFIHLAVLIVGLIFSWKNTKSSSFFFFLSREFQRFANFEPSVKVEKKKRSSSSSSSTLSADNHQLSAACKSGDMEIVLKSLGMVSNGGEGFCSRMDADDLFAMFEERNPSLEEVKAAFEVFDGNRDGFIDAEDLQKVLCSLGLKEGSEMENCRRMIRVFDEDEDGKLDFQNFVNFMENTYN